MSVLILGVNLPAEGEIKEIILHPDGNAHEYYKDRMYKAIPVPPHGRLGDLDAAAELAMQYCPDDDGACSKAGADMRELLDEIENLPTIIPAEEGE